MENVPWDRTARIAFPIKFARKMKIKETVKELPQLSELSLTETVDEQEIKNLLNEHSDSEYECQNDNE